MTHQNQKKIFLIINEFAGRRKKFDRAVKKLHSVLQANNAVVEYTNTNYPGHATELAAKAASLGFDIVVAVGGDGTVNEVAQGMIGKSTPMGIIPLGSGNGLARELGIPMNIEQSANTLFSGNPVQIDVCRINNQRFFCTSGIGFDAQVADKMGKARTRGFMQYIKLTIKESLNFKPFGIKLKIDDDLIEKKVFLVTFANARQFGNNAYIAPSASITDGLIDVIIANPFNKIWLPVFAVGLFAKFIHRLPFVESYKAKQIEIEFAGTSIYHFDGEPGNLDIPATVTVDTEKLLVISGRK